MLLRASRATEMLVKEAGLGTSLRSAFGGIGRASRSIGGKLWKHKKGLGTTAMVVGFPAMGAAEAVRRGNVGMDPGWTAARMQGQVARAPGMGWGRTR